MADGWGVPAAVIPIGTRAVLASLLALALAPGAVGQDASTRKEFVRRLAQSITVTWNGNKLAPTYKVSVAGPDSAFFVYHASLMNPSICRSMLTEGVVSKFRSLGFTKLVCTDDTDDTFAFEPVIQTVSPVDARKDYVEMERRSVLKRLGARTPSAYTLSADGPDATVYVHHQSVVTLSDCNELLGEHFISGLRGHGFVRLICTDDRSMTFAYDLTSQSPATAFALLTGPE